EHGGSRQREATAAGGVRRPAAGGALPGDGAEARGGRAVLRRHPRDAGGRRAARRLPGGVGVVRPRGAAGVLADRNAGPRGEAEGLRRRRGALHAVRAPGRRERAGEGQLPVRARADPDAQATGRVRGRAPRAGRARRVGRAHEGPRRAARPDRPEARRAAGRRGQPAARGDPEPGDV
ncbi:MAG: hypothetical protein AVDCRST_MAG64-1513, partial [uncultured Phycisphaerae bacterium]